jgi:hypothetical protein
LKTATIDLPFDGRQKSYDRDKLATAILVYLDVRGAADAAPEPNIEDTKATALRLRNSHGFNTDSITYAVGARIAVENSIEP